VIPAWQTPNESQQPVAQGFEVPGPQTGQVPLLQAVYWQTCWQEPQFCQSVCKFTQAP